MLIKMKFWTGKTPYVNMSTWTLRPCDGPFTLCHRLNKESIYQNNNIDNENNHLL